MELPRELKIEITPELIARAGVYTDSQKCPLATFIREALEKEGFTVKNVDAGAKCVYVYLSEKNIRYNLSDSFLEDEYIDVIKTNQPFQTEAFLIER